MSVKTLELELTGANADVSDSTETTGSKKRPFYRVVVTDSRTARDSRFVEVLGFYNPRTKPETLNSKRDRLEHWLEGRRAAVGHGAHAAWRACRTAPAAAGDRPPADGQQPAS